MKKQVRKVVGLVASVGLLSAGVALAPVPATAASRPTPAQIAKAMNTPTTLTFWTWVGNIQNEVKVFEKKYPKIKVKVLNVGQGAPHYQKLRAGALSGSGLPDVAQVEYQYIPTFVALKALLDISPYVSKSFRTKFVDWTVSQVSGPKGQIYGVPQDTGPMGLLYRKDIFDKYGITVPKTWEQFAAAAHKLHAADPNVYLADFTPNDGGWWNGLLWQAGSRPFGIKGASTVKIATDDANSKKVANYWAGLVKDGVVSTDPAWNNDWYAGWNSGKYATWPTAAWGAGFMADNAKDTAGNWRVAPMPQWSASGKPVAGNWGGSSDVVLRTTKNPIAAAQFAEFLNSNPKTTMMLSTQQFQFPAAKVILTNKAWQNSSIAFFGGQKVNKLFGEISSTVAKDYKWSPFQDEVYTEWQNVLANAIVNKGDVPGAVKQLQSGLVSYAVDQGFTVTH